MRKRLLVIAIASFTTLLAHDAAAVDLDSTTVRVVGEGGRCLDIGPGGTGTRAMAWACNDGAHQRWTLHPDGTLENGGLCLDAQFGSTSPGTAVILWGCHGSANQRWHAQPDGTIRGIGDTCLDVQNFSAPAGVVLWPCHGGQNQRWSVEPG